MLARALAADNGAALADGEDMTEQVALVTPGVEDVSSSAVSRVPRKEAGRKNVR
jgi:hypothetical protein